MFNQFKRLIIGQPKKQRTKRRKRYRSLKGCDSFVGCIIFSGLRSRTNTDYIISEWVQLQLGILYRLQVLF